MTANDGKKDGRARRSDIQIDRVARETFGWAELHVEQRDAIDALLDGRDVLAVLPTGAGKSAIYQVPGVLSDGLTVVVSPLLALQQDQIDALNDTLGGDDAAVAVNSAERAAELRAAWQAVETGRARFLFLSPEQLAKDDIVAELAELGITLFAVDEAHCVSAWGHDFRPDYLRLAPVIERLGHPTVVALTATAALPVRRDIVERLGLRDHREVVASFDRPNLFLRVHRDVDDRAKRAAVLDRVRSFTADPELRRGLIYVASRKDAQWYASELGQVGVRSAAYHAGMKAADRDRVHEQFRDDEVDVVCATSAFGMGIDKPDVRFVVHAAAPESLDSYYQQIGRAGRDGEPAEIVLFYRPEDLHLQRFLTGTGHPGDVVADVAETISEAGRPVRPAELADDVDASSAKRTRAVNLLEQAGALTTTADGRLEYLGDMDPQAAAAAADEVSEQHRELVRSRIEMMRGYAETSGCRRQFLLGYFGEEYPRLCGRCDTCESGAAAASAGEAAADADGPFRRNASVEHAQWGRGVVMSVEQDRLTVLFDTVGYKTLARAAVESSDLLAAG